MEKVGILGGTFNPPTNAHVQIASYVVKTYICDEVWVMPCNLHRFKSVNGHDNRLDMCELAFRKNTKIKVSTFEIDNNLSGSTFDLIKKLKEEFNHEFYFIIGSDNAINFGKWHKYDSLINMVKFIIFKRKGVPSNIPEVLKKQLILDVDSLPEISSSQIRSWLKDINETLTVKKHIDAKVYDYIISNNLYGAIK